jgi:beta-galactosidase
MHIRNRFTTSSINRAIASAGSLLLAASAIAAPPGMSLNGTWQFAHAATEADVRKLENFHQANFDSAAFQPTPVPSNWAMQGFESPTYKKFPGDKGPEGFYLRRFTVPADWSDRRVVLHFGGVWAGAEVWVNGKLAGRHDSGFTGFSFDVTKLVKKGDNTLAVRVRQTYMEYAMDANDDWSLGGIYRDVSLETMPKLRWLETPIVQTTFDDQFRDADLKVRVMVGDDNKRLVPGNYVGPGEPYELKMSLLDKAGTEIEGQRFDVPAHYGTGRETSATLRVKSPLHWTAETPNLYTLRIQLLEKGKVVHEREEKVGFRQISTAGGVFRINGQAVKLRGVNRHDEHPDTGRATTREQWIEDIKLMKEANINFIRLAHYPPARGFIELCDEMGMYVGNEVPFGYAGEALDNPAYASATLLRSWATVTRDLNNPSVIYWSIGNEDPLTNLHMASVRAVKAWDPTRPVLLPWRSESWLPPEIDIMAPHYWTAQENNDFAARSTRPVITTEFTHAYGEDGMGGLDERWRALIRHPAGAGGAIWMWADQGLKHVRRGADGKLSGELKVTPDGWDGIVDSYRKPTRDYWEAKAVFAPVFPVPERVTFGGSQSSVEVPIQNEFDFTDLSAVKIEWTLMEDDRRLDGGTAALSGGPHVSVPFSLPIGAIRNVRPGATYYAWFTFRRADGSEITRRTVELAHVGPAPATSTTEAPVTVDQGAQVVVRSGQASYVFDPASGQLASATLDGKPALAAMRPAVWRKLNPSETVQLKAGQADRLADLDTAQGRAANWKVTPGAGHVSISAKVDYTVDAANRYSVDYTYVIRGDGRLTVRYAVTPAVQAPWLPFVGMELTAPTKLQHLRWLGLGPLDAAPNMRTASILGVWSGDFGTPAITGVKAIRWAELTAGNSRFRVTQDGYIDTATGDGNSLRVLSSVVGKGSKGRRPEAPSPLLDTAVGKDGPPTYTGEFSIELR